jgi:hypothetical protein
MMNTDLAKNKKQKVSRWYLPFSLFVILAMLLSACGDPTPVPASSGADITDPGDFSEAATCDGKGQVSGQILVLIDEAKGLQPVPATITLTTAGTEPRTIKADADGNFQINDLDINEYEIEATVPGGFEGKQIQPKKKYLTVDDCQIETASMVLLAEGVTAPTTPPAAPQQQVVYVNQQPHYSITSNPFFWLWLFDRPGFYGYSYPPVYTTRVYNQGGYVYVPQQRTVADSRYSYTSYKPGDTTTTKVKAEPPVVSKGQTRIGSSGYVKPVVTPSSKGSSRPGGSSGTVVNTPKSGSSNVQAPGGSSSSSGTTAKAGSSSSGSNNKVAPPSGSSSKGSTRPSSGGKKK